MIRWPKGQPPESDDPAGCLDVSQCRPGFQKGANTFFRKTCLMSQILGGRRNARPQTIDPGLEMGKNAGRNARQSRPQGREVGF